MESVLISIRPKWCEKILGGEKTIEVRKSKPNEVPCKVFIYQTKSRDTAIYKRYKVDDMRSGKVIGEFICDKVKEYRYGRIGDFSMVHGYFIGETELLATGIGYWDFEKYGQGKPLYGWHISDLKIYDKPRELSEFRKPCPYGEDVLCHLCEQSGYAPDMKLYCFNTVTRPPQSWCYVEEVGR